MKRLTFLILAFALGTAGSAFAKSAVMNDAQMDTVAGGQALIEVFLVDVVDIERNQVQVYIPVNAQVAAGILGNAGAAGIQRPGHVIATQ
jgi:hypothetical protein